MNILLLDAYNLIYRARSGYTKGSHHVIFNFFRGLRPLVEKFNPDKVYFVLEGNPKFRKDLSEGNYKANRKSAGDDFHRQKAAIINIVKNYFPFEVVKHPDLECDDTIATLVSMHARKKDNCVVVSSDSDFIQLLNSFDIELYNPVRKIFIEKPAYDYVTWKALKGDATDNIPGIKGVGDKTALKLVSDKEKLTEFLKDKSNLATFERNVNLIRLVDFSNDMSLLEVESGKANFNEVKSIFQEFDFKSILKESSWKKYVETFRGLN